MDKLEQNFLSELCNMRLQIAYQRFWKERTAEEADKEQTRDNHIEELYNRLLEISTEEGKKIFKEYADEVAYSESDECEFYYLSGVKDEILLQGIIKKIRTYIGEFTRKHSAAVGCSFCLTTPECLLLFIKVKCVILSK